jgi:phenylacetate-CoA ligase
MPLLRFKTGDMVQAHTEVCGCGRNTMRLGPVVGRKKQMIKYKGTTLYPPAMDNILNDFSEVESYIIEISNNTIGTDEICIKIATKTPSDKLLSRIKDHFRAKLRVSPRIEIHDKKDIQKLQFPIMSRKPVMVIDNRKTDM